MYIYIYIFHTKRQLNVSSVWAGPLCGSVPCCLGRPSVRGGPLWVGPLWVPSLPVFPSPHVVSARLMSLARAPAPALNTHTTHTTKRTRRFNPHM